MWNSFGTKINKTEAPDKTPYTVYYPHSNPINQRNWNQPYLQIVSIDPARKNYALRIERRYFNGWITPIVFDKVHIELIEQDGEIMINRTYQELTKFLDKYENFYQDCHFIILERQLPQNYKATRIAQHTISYFSIKLANTNLLPSIVEVDPKLKGKILQAPKGLTDKQLKTWAVDKARELLIIRKDTFSISVLNSFKSKQDDLSDTVCQAEALFILWGLLPTIPPPEVKTLITEKANSLSHVGFTPTIKIINIILSDATSDSNKNQDMDSIINDILLSPPQPQNTNSLKLKVKPEIQPKLKLTIS